MIEAVIFDLDGVICTTDQYHYKAWKQLADREGIPFNEQVNNRLRGVSRMESLDIILERAPRTFLQEEKQQLAEEKNKVYRALLAGMSPSDLAQEVKSTLDALRARGKKLAIGSSSKNAAYILDRIGLTGYFDAVRDGTHIQRSKPDPQVFLLAAEALQLPPSACLVVEDAAAGVEAATQGGMDCAAVGDAAREGVARYCLRSIAELLSLEALA